MTAKLTEPQRDADDCTICAIAMATGQTYERVMEVARASQGGYRREGRPGTTSPRSVLLDLGFQAQRVSMASLGPHHRTRLLWGRRAILSVPSLNGYPGHHDVYWDGRAIRDPSTKQSYAPDALADTEVLYAVVFDETALSDGAKRPTGQLRDEKPLSNGGRDG